MAKFATMVREHGGTTTDQPHLPLSMLAPNPENMRLDTADLRAHIRSIADSILATGYLRSRPLTVRFIGETAIIVDGNCRFAAAQIAVAEGAEIVTLPCVLEPQGTTEAERLANMAVANSGLAHSPIEMTAIVKRLMSYGWTDTAVAKRLGKSRQWVENILELAGAPADVQQAISNGTVSATQAIKLIRSEGADAGAVIARAAEQQRAAGRETVRVTAKDVAPKPPTSRTVKLPVGLVGAVRELLRTWDDEDLGDEWTRLIETCRELVA